MKEILFELKIGDSIEGLKEIKANSVDVVVTSPPYNIGLQYKSYDDNLTSKEYLRWSIKWLKEVKRVLKPAGSLFLNIGAAPSNQLTPLEVSLAFAKYLKLQNTFHWIKSITIDAGDGDPIISGHFKPINSKRFVTDCHEYVFHFTKTGSVHLNRLGIGVPYKHKSNIKRWKHSNGSDKRCRGNTWFIPYETINRRDLQRPHPATFPVQLAKNCILIHGDEKNLTVLDPFVGLGNSAVAAYDCGVDKFIGFDIEEEYIRYCEESIRLKRDEKPNLNIIVQEMEISRE